jgi:hypothetical protein
MRQSIRGGQPSAAKPAATQRATSGRGARAASAIAVQRAVGNRAAARVLSRWVKHPDEEKKGVVVPDVSAAEYVRLNPPMNQ